MVLGQSPKDIAPVIYEASMRKNWNVKQALKDDAWILRISLPTTIIVSHIAQFLDLWRLLRNFHLDELAEDEITWKHNGDGHYSAASAYKAKFIGMVSSPFRKIIWEACPPPER